MIHGQGLAFLVVITLGLGHRESHGALLIAKIVKGMLHLEIKFTKSGLERRDINADILFLDKGDILMFGKINVQKFLDKLGTAIHVHLIRVRVLPEKHTCDTDKIGELQRRTDLVTQP